MPALKEREETFTFENAAKPVPSLLRGFSAPVILNYRLQRERAARPDGEATTIRSTAGKRDSGSPRSIILEKGGKPSAAFVGRGEDVLRDPTRRSSPRALGAAGETFLAEQMEVVDPDRAARRAQHAAACAGEALKDEFQRLPGQRRPVRSLFAGCPFHRASARCAT